jgi:3-hydroxyisobutyrate dehydrogenase
MTPDYVPDTCLARGAVHDITKQDPEVTTVGVIGLGDIGRGAAAGVVRAGMPLAVCDIRAEATDAFADTAHVAQNPAALAERCDVVVVAVVNDGQVMSVLDGPDGALQAAVPGSVVVVLSTVAPATVQAVAGLARRVDVDVVDCGVSGGPVAAAEGTLVAMVGGDAGVVARVRPALDAFTSLVVHMGPLGAGLNAKLARNLVQYGSWLAAYEAQVLAEAAGIELSKLAEVIRASDAMIGGASRLMFRDTVAPFEPDADAGMVGLMAAAAGLAHKDVRAAMELGASLGMDLPLARMIDERCDAVFGIVGHPAAAAAEPS